MSRVFYERRNRGTGWFEMETATQIGKGLNQGGSRGISWGNGLIRALDCEIGAPVWLLYSWNDDGIVRHRDGGHSYWEIALDEAAKWFSSNGKEPHELWFEDRKRGNISKPSGVSEPVSPELPSQTSTVARPLELKLKREACDRVPSVDQLVKVHQALWVFCLRKSYLSGIRKQEDEYLVLFCRLADALHPIRSLMAAIEGWPNRAARALPIILEAFDENARLWGWEGLAAPEPERSAHLAQQHARFLEHVGRARYEAALSWQAGCRGLECPPDIDAIADEGRVLGFTPTMTLEQAKALFKETDNAWHHSPRLGSGYPKIGDAELTSLERGWQALHDALQPIAPNETARAIWHDQPDPKPESLASSFDAAASNETQPPTSANLRHCPRPDDETRAAQFLRPAKTTLVVTRDGKTHSRNDECTKVDRDLVFISYSHQDKQFHDDLRKHLTPYLRKGAFHSWSDEQIEPGSIWFDKIKAALARTSVAVMLVSPEFLDSNFIHEHEFGPLLDVAKTGGVNIIWVLIRDCAWRETPLKDYQAVLPPEKPLAEMTRAQRDAAWRTVCQALERATRESASPHDSQQGAKRKANRRTRASKALPKDKPVSITPFIPTDAGTAKSTVIKPSTKVICPLHGIRTLAVWQKGLSDLAGSQGWVCRLDRWSYGRFSLVAFLTPWSREAKLVWLGRQYDAEINDRRLRIDEGQAPSVVAHSFGTYILGYTLLRYDFIRFDKVILCGSILPVDFPWDKLIERGQVQAVRNEFGVRDPWVKRVRWFVRGSGPSGASRFTCEHDRLEQEEFEYDHGDYFGIGHMEDRWIPFLNKPLPEISRSKDSARVPRPQTSAPWCLYGLLLTALLVAAVFLILLIPWERVGILAGYVTDDGTHKLLPGVLLTIRDCEKTKGGISKNKSGHFRLLRMDARPAEERFRQSAKIAMILRNVPFFSVPAPNCQ
jgi:hypothetical protein